MAALTPAHLLEVAAVALSLALGIIVLAVAPRAWTNRLLTGYLVLYAGTFTVWFQIPLDTRWSYNLHVLTAGIFLAIPISYFAFTSHAVDLPWLRPFRRPAVRAALVAAPVAAIALAFVLHARVVVPSGTRWAMHPALGRASTLLSLAVVATALVASLTAYARAAPGTLAKRRAGAYALAFGVQDVTLIPSFLIGGRAAWIDAATTAGLLASLVLLAVGLLRFQLFDFALKVKLGLERGTLAAVFLATFFVVAETAQSYLSDNVGYVAGGIAAGLLVFVLRPLERMASRVADRAMPNVEATPAYVAFKKLEVYRAAIEAAAEADGALSERERVMLDRLRGKLGIAPGDAAAVEADVLGVPRAVATAG